MHGESKGSLVINIMPMSEKEMENERLKKIARSSGTYMDSKPEKDCGCPDDMEIVRDLDVILFENMDGMVEAPMFAMQEMPRFARAMGANDDEMAQIQAEMAMKKLKNGSEPAALSAFKRDFRDMKRFGGDDVAMQLSREMMQEDMMMDDAMMDDMLSTAMTSAPMMSPDDLMTEAKSAMFEEFGRDAMFLIEDNQDGVVVFSIDSPEMGRVRYVYDSQSGTGRVMRGE